MTQRNFMTMSDAEVTEMRRAFERVVPALNWKREIAITLLGVTIDEVGVIKEAITFMTGSIAHASIARRHNSVFDVTITAEGYYAAIGA